MEDLKNSLESDTSKSHWAQVVDSLKRVSESFFGRLVILPVVIVYIYLAVIAFDRYESSATVMVNSPESSPTIDASMALVAGLGGSSVNSDAALVYKYIHSADMLAYLDETIDLYGHYSNPELDFLSRVTDFDKREDYLEYYRAKVSVLVDQTSGIIEVRVQAFTPAYAQLVLTTIIERTEWYINSLGHQMAESQVSFMQGEAERSSENLAAVQRRLLAFQSENGLIDPAAEGQSQQRITHVIESQISVVEGELEVLRSYMSDTSPQVQSKQRELNGLQAQLEMQRRGMSSRAGGDTPVAVLLAEYDDLKIQFELAARAYSSSLASLEVARVEAYKQLKFLSIVQSPTLPDSARYPRVFYNTALLLCILSALFVIISIFINVYREIESNR